MLALAAFFLVCLSGLCAYLSACTCFGWSCLHFFWLVCLHTRYVCVCCFCLYLRPCVCMLVCVCIYIPGTRYVSACHTVFSLLVCRQMFLPVCLASIIYDFLGRYLSCLEVGLFICLARVCFCLVRTTRQTHIWQICKQTEGGGLGTGIRQQRQRCVK